MHKAHYPAVSIILTTYNGASRGYLEEAIISVLHQSYVKFELIIIDDGSTDNTQKICRHYLADPRVSYHYQENKGLAAARNAGIYCSHNQFIAFLDDDDVYEKEKIAKQIAFAMNPKHRHAGLIYTGLTHIDKEGKVIGQKLHAATGDIYEQLFYGNTVCAPSSCLLRRSVLDKIGFFNEELKSCEDYDLWLRIAKKFPIYSLDEHLVRYRVHDDKMSANLKKMHEHQEFVLFNALQQAPENIRAKKNIFYHRYHTCCAHQYLAVNDYKAFRKHFRQSHRFGKNSLSWNLRYLLTYWPLFFRVLQKLKKMASFKKTETFASQ